MEFKEAMRIWGRMCKAYDSCRDCQLTRKCPLIGNSSDIDTFEFEAIFTKWAAEHPERTIADDFFEKHPKAPKDEDGIPFACAQRCGYTEGCIGNTSRKYCTQCWRRPLAEVE